MIGVSYRMPESLKAEIEARAEQEGRSASAMAVRLLREALGPKEKAKAPEWAFECMETFWDIYPRKTNKKKAMDILRAMIINKPDPDFWSNVIADAGTRYRSIENKKFIPHATTYLNGARWEDEVIHENARPNNTRTAIQEASDQTRRSALHAASLIAGDDSMGADDSTVREQVDQDGGEYIQGGQEWPRD